MKQVTFLLKKKTKEPRERKETSRRDESENRLSKNVHFLEPYTHIFLSSSGSYIELLYFWSNIWGIKQEGEAPLVRQRGESWNDIHPWNEAQVWEKQTVFYLCHCCFSVMSHFFNLNFLVLFYSNLKQIFSFLFENIWAFWPPLTAATKWTGSLTSSNGLCGVKQ